MFRSPFPVLLSLFILIAGSFGYVSSAAAIDLRNASNAVVKLYVTRQAWNARQPWNKTPSSKSVCSGFFIEEGILTNAHCVAESTYIELELPGDPDKHEAEIIAVNHQVDLALIRLKDPKKKPKVKNITFDALPALREKVVTVGYPVGGRQISFTEGVVSRIDLMNYVHSNVASLMVQTDAAINPGNSGGPVFSDRTGASLGVATQVSRRARGMGYFVPAPVINQFLKDVRDGEITGIPLLGAYFQALENPTLRESLRMKEGQSGVRVLMVAKNSSVDGILEKNDVMLELGGHNVLNDARLPFRGSSKIGLMYPVISKQVGEKIRLKILRDGKLMNIDVRLAPYKVKVIPSMPDYDMQPRYYEIAGFIFRAVDRRYIRSLGKRVPLNISQYGGTVYGEIDDLEELVVVSEVFASSVNKGYGNSVEDVRVMNINGRQINRLEDVIAAFEQPGDGKYHEIEFEHRAIAVLDRKQVEEEQESIRARYNITQMEWGEAARRD